MTVLSISSQIAFKLAAGEAKRLQSKDIDSEHLFLGLCKLEDILKIERSALSDIDEHQWQQALADVKAFCFALERVDFDPKKARRRLRKIVHDAQRVAEIFSGHRTERCKDLFSVAGNICTQNKGETILPQHLWTACLGQNSQPLDRLLYELSFERHILLNAMEIGNPLRDEKPECVVSDKYKTPILDKFGRDLTKLAREGKLDTAIGRNDEIKKVAQILIQKKKNNPVLIGEAGVGKTAVVEGFALKVIQDGAPLQIHNFRVIELQMGVLIAGTKYRGEFEERLEGVLKEAASDPDIVLFIDEIHSLVGAGANNGALDAGNILKPALARGDIKCIGATTTAEYRRFIEKDPALDRRFQVIWVNEPTKEETIFIMKGIREKFEAHHGVRIPDDVIETAVELSMRYLTDFRLPDKAIDLLDQACARIMLKTLSPRTAPSGSEEQITKEDIAKVVSDRCRIPVERLTLSDSEHVLNIDDYLRRRVLGQDNAIKQVGITIRAAKAGLKNPYKPVVFLFAGSTGTGKSELAKAVAEFLFDDAARLISLDMSEYQQKESVSKMIGSPPGYVGYEEEGQLTGKIRSNPYSVILFDEVEKAHPDVFDIFLQIFDEGRLTDSHGRRVNFSESVIIMTTNLGSAVGHKPRRKNPLGFKLDQISSEDNVIGSASNTKKTEKQWDAYESQIQKAIVTAFRPEFLNRIQKIITFYPLGRDTVKQIIALKILPDLNNRLIPKGVTVELSDEALNFLLQKGYSESFGAREMQRIFDQNITEPLSQMILKGNKGSGQKVLVNAGNGAFQFDIQ